MDEIKALDESPLGRRVLKELALRRAGKIRADGSPLTKSTGGGDAVIFNDEGDRVLQENFEGRGSIFGDIVLGPGSVVAKAAKDPKVYVEGDEMDDEEKADRGVAARKDRSRVRRGVSFADVISPKTQAFDITDDTRDGEDVDDADGSDEQDALGREYSDAVMERIAGAFGAAQESEDSAIPDAGAGEPFVGDTRSTGNAGFRPTAGDGTVGGLPRGTALPTQGYVDNEVGEASSMPVRVGPNFVMNPGNSGIADPAGFVAPAAKTSVLKRDARVGKGMFASAIFSKEKDSASGFLG